MRETFHNTVKAYNVDPFHFREESGFQLEEEFEKRNHRMNQLGRLPLELSS